jgi:hypothetical protein
LSQEIEPWAKAKAEFKKQYFHDLLKRIPNTSAAARAAKLNRTHLIKIMNQVEIKSSHQRHYGNWGDLNR